MTQPENVLKGKKKVLRLLTETFYTPERRYRDNSYKTNQKKVACLANSMHLTTEYFGG